MLVLATAVCRPAPTCGAFVRGSARPVLLGAPSFQLPRQVPRRALPVVAALPGAENLDIDNGAKRDLPQWLTLLGYAATLVVRGANVSRFQITHTQVYAAIAAYSIVWGLLSLADPVSRSSFDPVGSSIGPIFLGANFLGNFSGRLAPFDVAAFLFGYFWVDKLPQFRFSKWFWVATLAGAIYKGLAAQWLVAAFGLSALWRLWHERTSYHQAAFLGLAMWAFYSHVETPVALIIMAAQLVASAVI